LHRGHFLRNPASLCRDRCSSRLSNSFSILCIRGLAADLLVDDDDDDDDDDVDDDDDDESEDALLPSIG
jgi:hypothetical protein